MGADLRHNKITSERMAKVEELVSISSHKVEIHDVIIGIQGILYIFLFLLD